MSLFCAADGACDGDWFWEPDNGKIDFSLLDTTRSRKCCSCKAKIKPGDTVVKYRRWRPPNDRCNYIEERIYADEVPLAPWYMCETCGGVTMAVDELGYGFYLGDNIRRSVKQYVADGGTI